MDGSIEVSFIPMSNVSEQGDVDLSEVRVLDEVRSGFTFFRDKDVLFAKITPCMENGKGALVDNLVNGIGFGSTEFHVLRAKDEIDPKWLYYVTKSSVFRNTAEINMTGSAGQKRVPTSFFDKFKVFVPTIQQQRKIAEVLDKSQQIIDKRKEQIEACDELIKSQFIEMFGDPIINSKGLPVVPLGEVCNMKAGKSIKAADIFDMNENGMFPCYGGNGLRGYVKAYTHEGAIPLIGRQGALCGNVQFAQGEFYATEHAIVTQPKVEMNTQWLYIMLREMNLNRLASGAAQPGLNVSTLVPLEVINPPVEIQNQFAEFVQQVDKLKLEMQQSLVELENNFNSLMQRAFKGELF